MSNYDFYLVSTQTGGQQRDIHYDELCESLFDEMQDGRLVFNENHDLQALLFLNDVWRDPLLKRWLSRKYCKVSKEVINESNFLKLVGWMYRMSLFRLDLTQRQLAQFIFDHVVFESITKLHGVENAINASVGHKIHPKLRVILQKSCL